MHFMIYLATPLSFSSQLANTPPFELLGYTDAPGVELVSHLNAGK